jgi:acyl-CoA synthetase (NDP forming)
MIASASAEHYGRALRVLAADPSVDTLVVIFIPPVVTDAAQVAEAIVEAQRDIRDDGCTDLPIIGVFMSEGEVPWQLVEANIPSFRFPEAAAQSLGHVARYGQWRERPLGNVVEVPGADVAEGRAVVDEALHAALSTWLDAHQTQRLLHAFGIATARAVVVHDAAEAAQAAKQFDGAIAVKTAAPVHKTDIGGLRLGLSGPDQVADAVTEIIRGLKSSGSGDLVKHGFLVQEMISDGVEMAVGVTSDPTFGPVLMVGMGGTLVELLQDIAVRIHPLTDIDVDDMLHELRGYPLLTGYRGSAPVDHLALQELLFRLSALVEEVPEIAEADLNPVFVRRRGVATVDARIRVSREHLRRHR